MTVVPSREWYRDGKTQVQMYQSSHFRGISAQLNWIWIPRLPGVWRRFDWWVINDMKCSIRLLDPEDEGNASSETSANIYQSAFCSTQVFTKSWDGLPAHSYCYLLCRERSLLKPARGDQPVAVQATRSYFKIRKVRFLTGAKWFSLI